MHVDNTLAKRNTLILAIATALAGANSTVSIATASIVGYQFASDKSLATLPVSIYVVGLVCAAYPLGFVVNKLGRRLTYMLATLLGVLTGLVSAFAVYKGSFEILCLGSFIAGMYAAVAQSYRFAAADMASPDFKPKAISWTLTGGVVAAFLGPQLVIHTKDWLSPHLFLATYLAQGAVAIIAFFVVSLVKIPDTGLANANKGRSMREILKQPRYITALICGAVSYAAMNFVMTAAPLAMKLCGHTINNSTLGIQWHVLGMFAPSFFTGSLIARFGAPKIIASGFFITFLSLIVAVLGLELWNFWGSLVLLGIGWNFSYIGSSALVTECHRPEERATVQSFNDFFVYFFMAVGSFSSGQILVNSGWNMVNWVVLPFLLIASVALLLQGKFKTSV